MYRNRAAEHWCVGCWLSSNIPYSVHFSFVILVWRWSNQIDPTRIFHRRPSPVILGLLCSIFVPNKGKFIKQSVLNIHSGRTIKTFGNRITSLDHQGKFTVAYDLQLPWILVRSIHSWMVEWTKFQKTLAVYLGPFWHKCTFVHQYLPIKTEAKPEWMVILTKKVELQKEGAVHVTTQR